MNGRDYSQQVTLTFDPLTLN